MVSDGRQTSGRVEKASVRNQCLLWHQKGVVSSVFAHTFWKVLVGSLNTVYSHLLCYSYRILRYRGSKFKVGWLKKCLVLKKQVFYE